MATANERPPVLIIDDDQDIQDTLIALLRAQGFRRFETALDGSAGITLLESLSIPHIVLLDLMMPVLSGWEVLQVVAEKPALSKHKIAIMSASSPEVSQLRGYPFFQKPIDFSRLFEFAKTL